MLFKCRISIIYSFMFLPMFQIKKLRKQHNITAKGADLPDPIIKFEQVSLKKCLISKFVHKIASL